MVVNYIGLKRRIVVCSAVISVNERFFGGIRIIRRPGCEVKTNGFPRFSGWRWGGGLYYIMDSFNILCAHVL